MALAELKLTLVYILFWLPGFILLAFLETPTLLAIYDLVTLEMLLFAPFGG